jgi:hypothetical protein
MSNKKCKHGCPQIIESYRCCHSCNRDCSDRCNTKYDKCTAKIVKEKENLSEVSEV